MAMKEIEGQGNEVGVLEDAGYGELVSRISATWTDAKEQAVFAVNTQLLEANWQTGKYIVEFEQGGEHRAQYGKQLLVNLAKDLTAKLGKGFSRSNLNYMRKFYAAFPKCETLSHKLTWSHYFEILMEYAMEGITNQLFVAKYQLYLPRKEELQTQLEQWLDSED